MAESAQVQEQMAPAIQEKAPLFGKEEKKLISDPLNDNNPITVQVLGICSALAVTTLVTKAFVMSVAVIFVLAFSNLFTSMMRNQIPKQVRMIVQLVIIATLVTVVELTLKAVNYNIYKELSVFIGLIITNCIIMGRLEAYAMANKPWRSFLDGIGNGLGYGAILIIVAVLREIFGKGTLFAGSGIQINIIGPSTEQISYLIDTSSGFFSWYMPNNLMVLPASAMFVIGILIWIQRSWNSKLVDIS
ncbi:MAG: NADH:ubiquinone reductase (Na(+)-transporting) subunit D [Saprospiraceae bacterium]|jgi:Na+-transporting NADH:ubiquinone oxidoreductase subunit D